jgi:hypothetical protein
LHAEPVNNRALASYQIVEAASNCTLLKINFNYRVRYVSHFPAGAGSELRILVQPIEPSRLEVEGLGGREALRPPQNLGVKAIQYEARIAESPSLTILFDRPVNFNAAGAADFQSVVVSIADARHGKACKPVLPGGADAWSTSAEGETLVTRRAAARETVIQKRAPNAVPVPDVAPAVSPNGSEPTLETRDEGRNRQADRGSARGHEAK